MPLNKSPYAHAIAQELNLPPEQVAATIALLEAGNTLPFIARYRKEITGGLDEEQIRQISSAVERLRRLDKRRRTILSTIEAQGKLTPALRQRLLAAETMTALEDLYRPYKPKRRTRATVAKEKGLQGLADLILEQALTGQTVAKLVAPFLSDDVPTVEEALAGARDIVAETIADHADVRQQLREKALRWGMIRSERVHTGEENKENENNDPTGAYATYYDFEMPINRLRPHQVLAMNRGEAEKVLRLRVEITDRDWLTVTEEYFPPDYRSPLAKQLTMATEDAARRLLLPAIERSVRRHLTAQAETHAIAVFAANLRALLNQPPLVGHTVLGIDPGYRTGCKVAVADPTGKVLATTTIYPHEPQRRWRQALETLVTLIARYRVTLIAIGNGTASRETERLAAEVIHTLAEEPATETPPRYLIVSEAGASVYSASPLARAELPDLDVSMRGAVSIARRVQDPLAELVKIAPQSIGVGMYQHDVNRQALEATLHSVVESVVNQVGVDVNTASPALLTYVAGIGPRLAERIVAYRDENGPFRNRAALLRVPGIGAKTFEQAAGFLR
ncbi:MAG TPA: RNA-binding transcriptional accessory protein, partial [Chloroflexi bacterium]|nr:RNA-binding transcriptional accessory protein [Chloroflexota bacterium]